MDRRIVLWIVIGALFLATLFLTFKTGSVDAGSIQATGSAVKSLASQSSGMVGGC